MNDFVVVDIETTGLSPTANKITEIGAIKIKDGKVVDTFSQLINPECSVSAKITEITGLTNQILGSCPIIDKVLPEFIDFNEELPLMGHNVLFDYSFLKFNGNSLGYSFERQGVDTMHLAHYFLPDLKSKSLTSLIGYLGIEREMAHRAYHDALATYEMYRIFKDEMSSERDAIVFKTRPLHWRAKKESPITPKQKSYLSALVERYGVELKTPIEEMTKSQASKLIDSILFKYGRQ